jgi:membrane protein required for colicin V production
VFIDIVVFILLIIAAFKGLRKGFVVGLFSFFAFIIGLAAAIKLSAIAAFHLGNNINISQRWLPVLAFILVFLLVVFLVRLGARAIETMLRLTMLGWLNRLGGVILFVLIYLFIFSIILFYAEQVKIIKPETMQHSVVYPWLQPLAPKVINALSIIFPFFKNMFTDLLNFFEKVSANT